MADTFRDPPPPPESRVPPPYQHPNPQAQPARRHTGTWILGGLLLLGLGFVGILVLVGIAGLMSGGKGSGWHKSGPKVAVVRLSGPITEESVAPVIEDLKSMVENDEVKAVVLRVESPGGSISPSQELYATVRRLKEKKPIVVSMGQLAASGGYYVALPASKIYANPGTITGSIGVIMMSFVAKQLLEERLGIKPHVFTSGKLKDALSSMREPTPEDEAFIRSMIDEFYDQYAVDVLDARGIDPRLIPQIAQAQIVSGRQALALKMIDALGDLDDAAKGALALAGVTDREPVLVEPKHDSDALLKKLLEGSVNLALDRLGFPPASAATAPLQWRLP